MESEQIRQGISMLYDLEMNNYLMTRAIAQLDNQISLLGRYNTNALRLPQKAQNKYDLDEILGNGIMYLCIACIIGAIVGAVVGIITGGILDAIVYLFVFGFCAGCGGGVIGIIVGFCLRYKESQNIIIRYKQDNRLYDQTFAKETVRVERENTQKKFLTAQKQAIISRKSEASQTLTSLYNALNIDRKFRNIIPIGYMEEFIRLNISDHLEGIDGLYYLTRNELRLDQMQHTLTEISNKLDTIIDKQHRIYDEFIDMNRKCDTIIRKTVSLTEQVSKSNQSLDQIAANTAIAAYNSERAAQELAIQNFLLAWT